MLYFSDLDLQFDTPINIKFLKIYTFYVCPKRIVISGKEHSNTYLICYFPTKT